MSRKPQTVSGASNQTPDRAPQQGGDGGATLSVPSASADDGFGALQHAIAANKRSERTAQSNAGSRAAAAEGGASGRCSSSATTTAGGNGALFAPRLICGELRARRRVRGERS